VLQPRWKRAVEAALWFAVGWIVPEVVTDSGHHGMGEASEFFLASFEIA
jgi:hypothetical protein